MSTENSGNNPNYDVSLAGHEYDGIQEFDNPLPRWWLLTFYGTILFAVPYFLYYSFFGGPSLLDEFRAEQSRKEIAQLQEAAKFKEPDPKELAAILVDPERKKAGKEIFASRCVSCHGPEGGGGIGPNLTDDYWIHGGKPEQIAATIRKGVLDKGMPPWGSVLKPEEIYSAMAFVRSLHGTHPANAKAPQGEPEKD